jgi:hypothetical protein
MRRRRLSALITLCPALGLSFSKPLFSKFSFNKNAMAGAITEDALFKAITAFQGNQPWGRFLDGEFPLFLFICFQIATCYHSWLLMCAIASAWQLQHSASSPHAQLDSNSMTCVLLHQCSLRLTPAGTGTHSLRWLNGLSTTGWTAVTADAAFAANMMQELNISEEQSAQVTLWVVQDAVCGVYAKRSKHAHCCSASIGN